MGQGVAVCQKRYVGLEAQTMKDLSDALNQLRDDHFSIELIGFAAFHTKGEFDVFAALVEVADITKEH